MRLFLTHRMLIGNLLSDRVCHHTLCLFFSNQYTFSCSKCLLNNTIFVSNMISLETAGTITTITHHMVQTNKLTASIIKYNKILVSKSIFRTRRVICAIKEVGLVLIFTRTTSGKCTPQGLPPLPSALNGTTRS